MKKVIHGLFGRIRTKQNIIVVSLVGVLVLMGSYVLWSKYNWDTYQESYTGWKNTVKKELDAAMARPDKTDKDRQSKLKALEQVAASIESKQSTICNVPMLISWQHIWEDVKRHIDDCQSSSTAMADLGHELNTITAYLKDEASLSALLLQLPIDKTEIAETEWPARAAMWHAISAKVAKLDGHKTFKPVQEAAAKALEKVDASWQAVLAADKAKDEAKYQKTHTELVQAYSLINAIADANSSQFNLLLQAYEKAYRSIY